MNVKSSVRRLHDLDDDRAARQRMPSSDARAPRDPDALRNQRRRGRRTDGTLIDEEHDENGTGQEELYIVLEGNGDLRDRRADGRRARGNIRVRRAGSASGKQPATGPSSLSAPHQAEAYEAIDWGEAWPFHSESMKAYSEQRYADALEAVRGGLGHMPDHAGLHFNCACFATLAGTIDDDTFAHLRRSVELFPRFREDARRDDDFAAARDDPRLRGRPSLRDAAFGGRMALGQIPT